MNESILIGLASILVFGISAQWLAWKFKVPAILLLLFAGIMAGPVAGFLNPDELLGDLLLPVVSMSVALILFEGGLSLHLKELKGFGAVVLSLVTVGVLITGGVTYLAGIYILGLDPSIALLLGAVLVVTGPTVILPLLRHIRPVSHISSILKWEGIVIDPVGAMLALLVFEVVLVVGDSGVADVLSVATTAVGAVLFFGAIFGLVGAVGIILLLKKYLVPDFLQNPVIFMAVIFIFTVSDYFQHESGLFAVTLMGVVLANQKYISVSHIVEFKENLRVLLISSLFIVLAANLDLKALDYLNWNTVFFIAVLIFVARPISVFVSTLGSNLTGREKIFIMAMAPRGIVAAAISAVFSLRLVEAGHSGAQIMVPVTFAVIIGTVAFYGLGSSYLASLLGLARSNPQGVVIAGAHRWARDIAEALKKEEIDTILIDSNWQNITEARLAGLNTYYGSILSERLTTDIDLGGMGRLLALTPNDNINSLSAIHFLHLFESMELYQVAPREGDKTSEELKGRIAFGENATFFDIDRKISQGFVIKTNQITDEFSYEDFLNIYGEDVIPMFLINDKKKLFLFSADRELEPKAGQTLISLVKPSDDTAT